MLWEREQYLQDLKAKASVLGEPVVVPWGWSVGCRGRGKSGRRKRFNRLFSNEQVYTSGEHVGKSRRVESHDCKAL